MNASLSAPGFFPALRLIYRLAMSSALALLAQPALAASPAADLTIAKGHSGNFTQGDVGDSYTLTVTNAGNKASSGIVTVTDTLPGGLTATNIDGSGWSCALATLTCTRSDALPAGTSYAAITLTVDVAGNAATTLTNHATVSGGGESNTGNDGASDPTTVIQKVPDLSIDVFHSGTWSEGDIGKTYSLRVDNSNIGGFSTDGSTVTVVDTLSAGLTATAIGGPGWSCVLATLTCTRSDVLANFTTYPFITVTVNVAGNASTPQSSSATVSGGGDTNTVNNSWSDVTAIVQKPDLAITKSHSGIWNLGAVGKTYTLTASNLGGIATDGSVVTVVDALPAGLAATAIAGTGWSCTLGTLTCSRSDALAAGASYPPITVTVDVANDAPANMTNMASVAGGGETNTANDSASDPTKTMQIDLTLAKTHSGNFNPGDVGKTYTLTVSNAGAAATNGSTVTVVDTLPTGLAATAIAGSGWSCTLGTLTCMRSDVLAANSSYPPITVTVDVANDAPASVKNTATVAGGGELDTSNDGASDVTTINETDLTMAMFLGTPLGQGQGFASYFLSVRNTGTLASSGLVTVVDTLPSGLSATQISGGGWSCTLATLTCTRSDVLAAGASWGINLFVSVDNDAPVSVMNSATVSGGGEIDTANDTASNTASVTQRPDLSIAKSHSGIWHQGDVGKSYTITVSNVGHASTNATTVTVVDMLPAGLTATAIVGIGWSCVLGTLTCTRTDALPTGTDYPPITVTVNVANGAALSVNNTATVAGGGEINAANDSASDITAIAPVGPGVDLSIQMDDGTGGAKFFVGGQVADYTITVHNIGTLDAHDASVQGLLPSNLLDASWTCSASGAATCTASGSGALTDMVNVAHGASVTYHLTATVQATPESPVTCTASVAAGSGEADVNTGNNSATTTDAVGIFADDFGRP
ncbi:MAG TPA: hypothetical protein VHQ21_17590 [Rhodanobacteraceae bacterium]|nr:hypothetical protein [Rhodanobacteraceae bacterium]